MAPVSTRETQPKYIPPDLDDAKKFSKLKKSLIKPENIEKVKDSWKRLLTAIEDMAEEIQAEGSNYIPSVYWQVVKDNNGQFPKDVAEKFKSRGCVIVRGVVDEDTCLKWRKSMGDFVTKHPEVGGYPNPISNWFAFWTEGEVKARSHPEIIELMKVMSQFFYVEDTSLPLDIQSQVVYPDAFRIRQPGHGATLDLHLDAGSIERWEDQVYSEMYGPIFEGRWEDWEPWRLDERAFAKSDLYTHLSRNTATSCFRALQGWLALSSVKSGEGTIRFLPNIKLVNAYSILRPYFWRDDGEIDLETPKFPGVIVGSGQFFCRENTHPHLRQLETVFSIPYANTGDYVFWHSDLAHEVDKQHNGKGESSVFFNAFCPLCPYNIESLIDTRDSFKKGMHPKDFRTDGVKRANEGDFEDHGARRENILSLDGLKAMGLEPFDENEPGLTEGQMKIRKIANESMETGMPPKW